MSRDVLLSALIVFLAILGLGVSIYLLYEHYVAPIACVGSGCALVDASPYSEIFGVPLSILGLASYVTILILGLFSLRAPTARVGWLFLGIFGLALTGVLFSAYLTYLELAVIHAICIWCVTSAVLITAIAVLSALGLKAPAPITQSAE